MASRMTTKAKKNERAKISDDKPLEKATEVVIEMARALWLEGMPPVRQRRIENISLMPALRLVSNTMSALANWAEKRLNTAETNTALRNSAVIINALWFSINGISVIIAILVKPSSTLCHIQAAPRKEIGFSAASMKVIYPGNACMTFRTLTFVIGPDDVGRRLDRILRSLLASMPLSMIYRLFRDGAVRVSGKRVDGAHRTVAGETIEVRLADLPGNMVASRGTGIIAGGNEGTSRSAAAFFAGLIIVETPDLVIINKPRGMLSHGHGGIDEAAIAYFADRIAASLAFTPAPLHRLDRNTSGALAVSASLAGAITFSQAIRSGLVGKSYIAMLEGTLPGEELWIDELTRDDASRTSSVGAPGDRAPGHGAEPRRAETRAIPLLRTNGLTLALVRLGTGRTHQIRAQAAAHGYVLAGDIKYGGQSMSGGYILHSAMLVTPPGVGSPDGLRVSAPLPPASSQAIARLFGEDWTRRMPPIT